MNTLNYYLMLDGERQGPFTVNQLRELWKSGKARLDTLFWSDDGWPDWRPLSEIREVVEPQPRFVPDRSLAPGQLAPRRSFGLYIVLGIFLGGLGIHNFYAGYIARGLGQLLITLVLGWWLPIVMVVVLVWVLVELIAVRKDSRGQAFY